MLKETNIEDKTIKDIISYYKWYAKSVLPPKSDLTPEYKNTKMYLAIHSITEDIIEELNKRVSDNDCEK